MTIQPRQAEVKRETKETSIFVKLNLDGSGDVKVNTGIGFFDHMLNAALVHGYFDAEIQAEGDLFVDDHHTVEDTGIVLGRAFNKALGDFSGIKRFGSAAAPMDEALARVDLDLSRRPELVYEVAVTCEKIGNFDTQLMEEFWRAFVNHSGANMHIEMVRGKNMHHVFEAVFKAAGRALDAASALEPRAKGVTSTKGSL